MSATGKPSAPPRASVIIPTFNGAGWIACAVASVLEQDMGDFELLVVDDGSTDGTRQVIEAVGDGRVRYILQPHAGVAAARNHGLDEAAGDFIAWLDGDDLWPREYLGAMTAALAAGESGVARSSIVNVYPDGRQRESRRARRPASGWVTAEIFENAQVYLQAMVMRRAVFAGLRFDETLRTNEDLDMGLRLSCLCPFAFVPTVQVVRHVRHGSLSQPARAADVDVNKPQVLERFYSRLGGEGRIPRRPARRRLGRAYNAAARRFDRFGARAAAAAMFRRALAYDPFLARAWLGLARAGLRGPRGDSLPGWQEPPPLGDGPGPVPMP